MESARVPEVWRQELSVSRLEVLTSLYALNDLQGFGPKKAALLFEAGVAPEEILTDPELVPFGGKTGDGIAVYVYVAVNRVLVESAQRVG